MDRRRMMTKHTDNVIRVFVGKGTSGATIIDNANRALSEPVPYVNGDPITIQWDEYSDTNAKLSFKNTTPDTTTIDTEGANILPPSYIGTSTASTNVWLDSTDERVVATKSSNIWIYITYPTTSGYARLLFASAQDMSAPIPGTISGNLTIQGITYRLEEAPVSDFI